jgi:hypothetical protein
MQTISLNELDYYRVQEIMKIITAYKERTLSRKAWDEYVPWLKKFNQQLRVNQFVKNSNQNNTFLWLADQIEHCETKIKRGKPLASTELGQQVLQICQDALQGQRQYDMAPKRQIFASLFDGAHNG